VLRLFGGARHLCRERHRRKSCTAFPLVTHEPIALSVPREFRFEVFAPAATMLACGAPPSGLLGKDVADRRTDWPDDLCEIVYVDHFGNAMTGLRAAILPHKSRLAIVGRVLERAVTFSDRPPGESFWYENSNGLAEIAVNQGRADRDLGLAIGTPVEIIT